MYNIIETFAAIVGVWGAIANKMEASQETCVWGKNNPSPPPPDHITVCSKNKSFHTVIFEIFESLCG